MIKIYGLPTCPGCDFVHEQVQGREDEFTFINIGSHVMKLKEFMRLRDSHPAFDDAKKNGYIGIPCFVKEDGSLTFSPEEVGLTSLE